MREHTFAARALVSLGGVCSALINLATCGKHTLFAAFGRGSVNLKVRDIKTIRAQRAVRVHVFGRHALSLAVRSAEWRHAGPAPQQLEAMLERRGEVI